MKCLSETNKTDRIILALPSAVVFIVGSLSELVRHGDIAAALLAGILEVFYTALFFVPAFAIAYLVGRKSSFWRVCYLILCFAILAYFSRYVSETIDKWFMLLWIAIKAALT